MLFALMKRAGVKCEYVPEYAKWVVYRGDLDTLRLCQPSVFGKQYHAIKIIAQSVHYVITDSPLALSAVYGDEADQEKYIKSFNEFDNINFMIELDTSKYKAYGRLQTSTESLLVQEKIRAVLTNFNIPVTIVTCAEEAFGLLQKELKLNVFKNLWFESYLRQ